MGRRRESDPLVRFPRTASMTSIAQAVGQQVNAYYSEAISTRGRTNIFIAS